MAVATSSWVVAARTPWTVGDGVDTVSYDGSDAGVTVNLRTGEGSGGHAAGDNIRGFERIIGSAYGDTLTGDDADNTLHGNAGADTLDGGGGNDRLEGSVGDDTLWGGTGNDHLDGSNGADTLDAGDGNDWLHGGNGADTLDGGDGDDTVSYRRSDAGVTVNLHTGEGSGGDATGDSIRGVEHIFGSAFADMLTGDDGNNVIEGNGGADTLDGDSGNDWLDGGAGADTLDGGDGEDTVSYAGSYAGVRVNLYTGEGSGGYATGDSLRGLENIIGSEYRDWLTGDDGNNVIAGNAGQ